MWMGTLFALIAGMMWGLVFVGPLLLPEYSAALLSAGRYLAFGLIALPLAWFDRARLRQLGREDWLEALKLSAVGNLLYYLCLASAIRRDGSLPWARLLPSLGLIAAGIGCVNQAELHALEAAGEPDWGRYASGALLAMVAVACWTWYPLRNADWLRDHPGRSPRTWATAQGLVTLPMALLGYALLWLGMALTGSDFAMPLGPRPEHFVALMVTIALLSSWVGTLCWNEASQRLPTSIAGQLIVFETLAALGYAFLLRGQWPAPLTLAGIALLIVGVLWAVRVRPVRD